MTDFTVHTPEQIAEHDAALRELQADNERLRAHILEAQKACEILARKVHAFDPMSMVLGQWCLETNVRQVLYVLADRHLAALNPTESAALGETK